MSLECGEGTEKFKFIEALLQQQTLKVFLVGFWRQFSLYTILLVQWSFNFLFLVDPKII